MKNKNVQQTPNRHLFQYRTVAKKRLILSLIITLVVMVIEIIGGVLTNSIALISDAGHMFTHAFAISIGLCAVIIARKPPCHHKTYGMYRAEVLAAFINGLFLIPIVGLIIYESIIRILHPQEINSFYMLMIAIIGLVTNLTSIMILQGSYKDDINVKGVFYHMIGDAASSIGIVLASIVVYLTGWTIIDPIVSFGIAIVILFWAWGILKDSTRILLQMAPKGLNTETINADLKTNFNEIKEIFNVHLWTIIPNMLIFSAYVILYDNIDLNEKEKLISGINKFLKEKYNIIESTIQISSEIEGNVCFF
ncbi:MAG: cation diffusion facilitator family transporter [Promethearchaeota archaeon]